MRTLLPRHGLVAHHGITPVTATDWSPRPTDSEWLRICGRPGGRRSPRRAREDFEFLPDGGLVRSERLARLEAALLIAESPTAARRLAQVARLIDADEVRRLIDVLNTAFDRERSAFRVEATAGGYVLMTRAVLAPWLDRLHQRQSGFRLSQPAMETLTIIAYQQPVTRADVEAIRGVQSSEMIRHLIDRGLVRVAGEEDSLGRPFLYETTRQFLSMFGLQQISDLPDYQTLRRQSTAEVPDGSADAEPESDEQHESPDDTTAEDSAASKSAA